jgi:hypothetical protein
MGIRIAVWLDDDLEERLNALFKAMTDSPAFRDLEITKSAVIKALIRKGLPFMEIDQDTGPFTDGQHDPLLIGWIDTTVIELLDEAERRGLKLPHYEKRKK